MCGITGIIRNSSTPLNEIDFQLNMTMTKALRHRGPDSLNHYNDNNVSLGNTRLNILDTSSNADLPLTSEDGSIVLCYNGEITNFVELKSKYQLHTKYKFKSTGDSEVLLYLYKEIGLKIFDELSGMFAFAIYDKNNETVLLARDFYGINPLFYTHFGHNIYFSSEIKSLLEIPGFERKVNPQALYDYFTMAYVPGSNTMFENITEVRNGEMIEINLKNQSFEKKYHYRMKYETNYDISFEEAKNKIYDLLLNSVERNLRSDASIGTTLSGGVDTSGITCLIDELGMSKNFNTFSIRMGEDSFDESHFQRLVSNKCRTNHHEFHITPEDVQKHFYEHIYYLDEPLGNGAPIPIYILAKHASKHVKVLLSGEGGDEVFNAYSVYQAWKVKKNYTKFCPKFIRNITYSLVHKLPSNYSKLSFDFQAKRFTEGCELHPAAAHIYWRHPFTNSEKDSFVKYRGYSTDERFIKLYNEYSATEELNRIAMLDMEHFITDDLLLKNDRMFYAHSIEGRYPYLDRKLIDFAQTLPTSYKLKGLKGRYIQKQALKKVLPKEIMGRQNYGLEMPHSIWFFKALKPLLEKYLNQKAIEETNLLSWEPIKELIDSHFSGKRDYGRGLWCIAVFVAWHQMYIQSDNYRKFLRF